MLRKQRYMTLAAVALLGAFLLGTVTAPPPAQALSLGEAFGDLAKIFGIGWVVKHFSGEINDFINKALKQREAAIEGHTKVVPIIRVGSGTAVGAAQVMGPKVQVDKVQAVAEVELGLGSRLRGRGLIPVATKDLKSIKGVGGVGVSANIKFEI